MLDESDLLNDKVASLPNKPGVYQYLDKKGEVIYVGKAKDLKKRVSSYFNKSRYENHRLQILVSRIHDIQYIVVESESDALLLENNLIKKYQPRYNVQLKDDKTFPWICIKNEPFPRVFSTRNVINDGSMYYGPYTSANMVRVLLDLVRQLYPLRTCNYNLTQENIEKGKFKECLEYHMGNCKAPCIGYQTEEDYNRAIENIRRILKGDIQEVIHYMKNLMNEYASNYRFEEAQSLKEKIHLLEKYKSRSTVVNSRIDNVDVFSTLEKGKSFYINYLKVTSGRIVQSHTLELKKKLDEDPGELLQVGITEIREKLKSRSKELVVPYAIDYPVNGIKVTVPKKGDKKRLLELSERNLKYYHFEKEKRNEKINRKFSKTKEMEQLREDLRMQQLPNHIECFDNSNIQGSNPVASCVVFRNGKPSKNEYRQYNIKTVEGPDDYASMREVVFRRYRRLLNEGEELPQLIVIDGGKGQLSAALESLRELDIHKQITIIGIAKKLEEIFLPDDPVPLYLDKNSSSLRTIQHLRDEAHRFGVRFHRQKRSQSFTSNELENIQGIGPQTARKLLEKYGSTAEVKKLDPETLEQEVGKSKAKAIINHFASAENKGV
ncbi:MAG: excinuclease ABC subunit C [Bacteroidales bacterium]|nr:excinuclease ABC subunit C [Bacteroidales bacterium]